MRIMPVIVSLGLLLVGVRAPAQTPNITTKVETSGVQKDEFGPGSPTRHMSSPMDIRVPATMQINHASAGWKAARALGSVNDVGIIPGVNGCPAGSETIEIFMDDEDDDNADNNSGWIGAIHQDTNTTFKFCRVDGTPFSNVLPGPFAVLQLGATCPSGSKSYTRLFENERNHNINHASSSFGYGIDPNLSFDNYTQLSVCVFDGLAPYLATGSAWNFPDFGVEYGVFASTDLAGAPAYGSIHTDDEDGNAMNHNHNAVDPPDYYYTTISRIISDYNNTDIRVAKVRPYCVPASALKINGSSSRELDIVGPEWPIVLDGSGSSCADSYFVSIQLSDHSWNRYGSEAMRWLTSADFATYGPINHFNMKKFAEDQWCIFVPGQYYRVKLAVGPTWNEKSSLIFIKSFDPQTPGFIAPLRVLGHVEGRGDMTVSQQEWVGTMGKSLRLEGFSITFTPPIPDLGLEYMAHLAGEGDTPFVPAGQFVGTRGEARRLEGFAARLTGTNAWRYDVFYQCHMEGIGNSAVLTGSEFCGTRGQSRRVEALRIWIVAK